MFFYVETLYVWLFFMFFTGLTLILPAESIYDSHFFTGKMLQKVLCTSLLKKFKFLPKHPQICFII
jgi:hypothetical protein